MRRRLVLALAGLALVVLPGCTLKSGFDVVAADLDGPVSFNNLVYDQDGKVLRLGTDLVQVDQFSQDLLAWSMYFGREPLSHEDISEDLNELMADAEAEGIVLFRMAVVHNGFLDTILNGCASVIPIIPSVTRYRVFGVLVRRVKK